jgi:hypothetical protein
MIELHVMLTPTRGNRMQGAANRDNRPRAAAPAQ